jgi:hypothetical protein
VLCIRRLLYVRPQLKEMYATGEAGTDDAAGGANGGTGANANANAGGAGANGNANARSEFTAYRILYYVVLQMNEVR